jgi:hypothetical protein
MNEGRKSVQGQNKKVSNIDEKFGEKTDILGKKNKQKCQK